MEKKIEDKFLSYATGIGSILDLSGHADSFRCLTRHQEFEGDWEAIGEDFEAVGDYLQKAVVAYFRALPREKQIEVVKELLKALEKRKAELSSSPSDIVQGISNHRRSVDIYSAEEPM